MSTPRLGCDLVSIADIGASIDQFGDRYLRRVFTDHELATCTGPAAVARLAARFAAKEATIKVLGPQNDAMPLRDIEIRSLPGGVPTVALSGFALELAERQELQDFQVSLSHEPTVAMAVVAATRRTSCNN